MILWKKKRGGGGSFKRRGLLCNGDTFARFCTNILVAAITSWFRIWMDDLLEHFYVAVPFTTSGYFTSGFRASYVVIVESRQEKAASSRDDGR